MKIRRKFNICATYVIFILATWISVGCKTGAELVQEESSVLSVGESLEICSLSLKVESPPPLPDSPEQMETFVGFLDASAASCADQTGSYGDSGQLSLAYGARFWKVLVKQLPGQLELWASHLGKQYKRIFSNTDVSQAQLRKLKELSERTLKSGDADSWEAYVKAVAREGTPDDAVRTTYTGAMLSLSETAKARIFGVIKREYTKAYYKKRNYKGHGISPKRAFDAILRYTLGPEKFFTNVRTSSQAMDAWRNFQRAQYKAVFEGSDFGRYTADDVLAVARRMQKYLQSEGARAGNVEILLKGSFPAGRANLSRRADSAGISSYVEAMIDGGGNFKAGMDKSHSDIDFLINKEYEGRIKSIEANIYESFVSSEARNFIAKTKAKPTFQSHPHPWDFFAELDGAMMSPVGLRVNQRDVTLIIYKPYKATDLPSKEQFASMSETAKKALYDKLTMKFKL